MPEIKFPPETVEEAVDYLQTNMPLNYEIQLITMNKEDLFNLHFSLGTYVRSTLGLWSGNEKLIESCCLLSGHENMHADDASMVIIDALWKKLQDKNSMGLVSG